MNYRDIPAHAMLRRCRFTPYRKGMGPVFTLSMWDTYRQDNMGKSVLGYRLTMREPGSRAPVELFAGDDFACSPMHAIDSDQCVESLMSFLTLRPGDTDSEYFDKYTPAQLNYCAQWAEALNFEVMCRFDPESGS